MKKKMIAVILFALSLALVLTAVGCASGKNADQLAETETETLPANETGKGETVVSAWDPNDPFESYYEIATEEQRAKLDEIQGKYPGFTVNDHERELKIIMGELPEDTPRLTKEDAERICASVDVKGFDSPDAFEEYVVGLFNEVAGAPDLNSGSGVTHRMYYTDDSETDLIDVCCGVWYYDPVTDTQEALLSLTDPSDD